MKKGFKILLAVVAVVIVVVALFFMNREQNDAVCQKITFKIQYPETDTLFIEADIKKYLDVKFPKIKGTSIAQLDISGIERYLDLHPYILDAEVYSSFNGDLSVSIKQRQPMVRVMDQANSQFYVDKQGMRMPLSERTVCYLPIVTGYVPSLKSDTLSKNATYTGILKIVENINADSFFKNQIDQIYVTPKQEFEMVPKVGNQLIIFGGADKIEEKFDKLKLFYEQGIPKVGWMAYKGINLKFENQVVCIK